MPDGRDSSKSGVLVYPRMPVPKRSSEPKLPDKGGAGVDKRVVALFAGAVIAGGAVGWFLRPAIAPDSRIGAAEQHAAEAEKTAASEKERAAGLGKLLETATKARNDAEEELKNAQAAQHELSSKTADADKQKKDVETIASKLKPLGSVAVEGDEVHLMLSDRVLFHANDDALTTQGKAALGKVASAIKEIPGRVVWVQGHTDDTPVPVPTAPKPPPAKKGQKPTPPAPAPVQKFATNWELSAARALAVVHFFQDVSKIDPSRLGALAFSQYQPISKKDKSLNRRIELVLRPR